MSNDFEIGDCDDTQHSHDNVPTCPKCDCGLVEIDSPLATHQCNRCGGLFSVV